MEMKTKALKATAVVSRILEIACLVAFALYVAMFVVVIVSPETAAKFLGALASENNGELSVQGFDILVLKDGEVIHGALIAFALAGFLIFACRAMIFRNIYLTLRTAAGKTKFATGETPFQKDITRMVREIGIFYILIPVLGLFISMVFTPIIGNGDAEISMKLEGILTGLVIIALSQIFDYGEKLEGEVEGLV